MPFFNRVSERSMLEFKRRSARHIANPIGVREGELTPEIVDRYSQGAPAPIDRASLSGQRKLAGSSFSRFNI